MMPAFAQCGFAPGETFGAYSHRSAPCRGKAGRPDHAEPFRAKRHDPLGWPGNPKEPVSGVRATDSGRFQLEFAEFWSRVRSECP